MMGQAFHAKLTSKKQVENDKTQWNYMKSMVNLRKETPSIVELDEAGCSKDPVEPEQQVYHLSWAVFKQLKG